MPLDLTDTGPQSDRSPIPTGVYRLRAKLKAGTAGPNFELQRAKKNGVLLMLALECTVIEGPYSDKKKENTYHGRKLWDYVSCELDLENVITPLPQDKLENFQTAVRMGRNKLRAIIDSAYKLDPNDKSEAAQAIRRRFNSYAAFDGIVFWAQVEERPARNGYRAGNDIYFIVTPDLPDYPQQTSSSDTALTVPPPKTLRDEMEDEIPF
jgi:hypothetical protein